MSGCLGLPGSDCGSWQHRQDRWLEFVRTIQGHMGKAKRGRSDPVLDLCGWECRGRGMYARAYRLCGKQDLNWAAAWSTAAHWSSLHRRHVYSMDSWRERLNWIACTQYSPNNSRRPLWWNDFTLAVFVLSVWHGLLYLAVPDCVIKVLER